MPTTQLKHSWGGTATPGCFGHTDARHTIQGELLFFRNEVKTKKKLANYRAGNTPCLRLSHRNLPEPEVQHVPSSPRNRARTVQAGTVTTDTVAAMSVSCCVFLRSKKPHSKYTIVTP